MNPGVNACDSSDNSSFVPEAERDGIFVGFNQDLTEALTFDARAFYGRRESRSFAPLRGQVTVTSNQFYQLPTAVSATAPQTVTFDFSSVLGDDSPNSGTQFEEWGLSTELAADLGDNFQLRALLNYSDSDSSYFIVGLNPTLLEAAGAAASEANAVNFYDPAATTNLDLIRQIADSEIAGQGRDSLLTGRLILDGTLFTLPGGDVQVALGAERMQDDFKQRIAPPNGPRGSVDDVVYTRYDRQVSSLFGEIRFPSSVRAIR